jgi:energy-coupling factor transport system ATP-binding protein
MRNGTVCSLRGVGYTYPGALAPALTEFTLDVSSGAWIALLGNNGSGKSTCARMLNALLIPTQGSCVVLGYDTSHSGTAFEVRRRVAMVFQNPENQIVAATVEEDVAFGPENLGLESSEIQERVEWALGVTGLSEMRKRPSYALSGGQKQRLALAGALALRPLCLVLDEATSMLDPQGRRDLMRVLRELHAQGMTIVSITHNLEEILFCTEACILAEGRLAWKGTPMDLLESSGGSHSLEVSPFLELWRRLKREHFLGATIFPEPKSIAEALCRFA